MYKCKKNDGTTLTLLQFCYYVSYDVVFGAEKRNRLKQIFEKSGADIIHRYKSSEFQN